MEILGVSADLKQAYLQLTMADAVLQDSIDGQAAMLMREQVRELAYKLRDAANRIVWLSREESVTKRSSYLQVVFESFAYLSGIVLCAAFLMVRLFKGVQEASQAKQLLKQEQELSDLVISNISNQGIVMFDGQLRCLLWNPGMEDLLDHQARSGGGPADAGSGPAFREGRRCRSADPGDGRDEFDPRGRVGLLGRA